MVESFKSELVLNDATLKDCYGTKATIIQDLIKLESSKDQLAIEKSKEKQALIELDLAKLKGSHLQEMELQLNHQLETTRVESEAKVKTGERWTGIRYGATALVLSVLIISIVTGLICFGNNLTDRIYEYKAQELSHGE